MERVMGKLWYVSDSSAVYHGGGLAMLSIGREPGPFATSSLVARSAAAGCSRGWRRRCWRRWPRAPQASSGTRPGVAVGTAGAAGRGGSDATPDARDGAVMPARRWSGPAAMTPLHLPQGGRDDAEKPAARRRSQALRDPQSAPTAATAALDVADAGSLHGAAARRDLLLHRRAAGHPPHVDLRGARRRDHERA